MFGNFKLLFISVLLSYYLESEAPSCHEKDKAVAFGLLKVMQVVRNGDAAVLHGFIKHSSK